MPSKNELRKKIRKARLEAVDSIIWNLPAGKRLVKNSGLMSEMLLIFCISDIKQAGFIKSIFDVSKNNPTIIDE